MLAVVFLTVPLDTKTDLVALVLALTLRAMGRTAPAVKATVVQAIVLIWGMRNANGPGNCKKMGEESAAAPAYKCSARQEVYHMAVPVLHVISLRPFSRVGGIDLC